MKWIVIIFRPWHEQTQSSDLRHQEPVLASSWPANILRGPHRDAEAGRAASLVRSGWGHTGSARNEGKDIWQDMRLVLSLSSSLPLSLVCVKSRCSKWSVGYESLQLEGTYWSLKVKVHEYIEHFSGWWGQLSRSTHRGLPLRQISHQPAATPGSLARGQLLQVRRHLAQARLG